MIRQCTSSADSPLTVEVRRLSADVRTLFERRSHRDQSQPDQGDDGEPVPATAVRDLQIERLSAWDQEDA